MADDDSGAGLFINAVAAGRDPPTARQPIRVAFGCQARVGKDTACEHLVGRHGFQQLSFSQPLKKIMNHAQDVCGFPPDKDRRFLQWIGTEWARQKDPDVWVKVMARSVEAIGPSVPICVSDVRFPNEMASLRAQGFRIVRIRRAAVDADEAALQATIAREGGIQQHASETALSGDPSVVWDAVMTNDGTIADFQGALDILLWLWQAEYESAAAGGPTIAAE